MPTRNPIKTWFVTFPQWKDRKRQDIKKYFNILNYTHICVCLEKHKDGGHHFHVLFKCAGITHSALLKHFAQVCPEDYKRIHFKPVRSVKKSLAYCHKEDKNPYIKGFALSSSLPTVRETVQGFLKAAHSFPRIPEHQATVLRIVDYIKSKCQEMKISETALFKDIASQIKYHEFIMTGLQCFN